MCVCERVCLVVHTNYPARVLVSMTKVNEQVKIPTRACVREARLDVAPLYLSVEEKHSFCDLGREVDHPAYRDTIIRFTAEVKTTSVLRQTRQASECHSQQSFL